MNSRFKFRVFYKKDKEYLDPEYYEEFCMSPDGEVHIGLTDFNGIQDEFQRIPQSSIIIEQCTGLKDKNGKLIFEGDIVQYNGKTNGTVLFRNGCFVWDWKVNDPPIYGLDSMDLEIIGNIREGVKNENR